MYQSPYVQKIYVLTKNGANGKVSHQVYTKTPLLLSDTVLAQVVAVRKK